MVWYALFCEIELASPLPSLVRHSQLTLDGIYHEVVGETIAEYGYNLAAIQLPLGTKTISKAMISLLGNAKSAVLILKNSIVFKK